MSVFQWVPDENKIYDASYGSQVLTQPHFNKTANTEFIMDANGYTLTLNSLSSTYWPSQRGDEYGVCNIGILQGTLHVHFSPNADAAAEIRIGAYFPRTSSRDLAPPLTSLTILGELAVTNVPAYVNFFGSETNLMKTGAMVITGIGANCRLASALISVRDNAYIQFGTYSFSADYGALELHDDSRVDIVVHEMVAYNTLNISVCDKALLTIQADTILTSELDGQDDDAIQFSVSGEASNIEFISTGATSLFDFTRPISLENKNRFTFNFLTKDKDGTKLPKNNGEITFNGFTGSSLKKQAAALLGNGYLSIDGQTVTDSDQFVIYTSAFTNRIEVSLNN